MEYYTRCHEMLKKLGAPLNGWQCVEVIDNGSVGFQCELCGYPNIRYIHVMQHSTDLTQLSVGCICAGIMEGDIIAAKERDHQAKLRSHRKSNYLKKQWIAVSENRWQLRYKQRQLVIERAAFRGCDYFKLTIDCEQYQWKDNRRMVSFLSAQHYAFALMEEDYA